MICFGGHRPPLQIYGISPAQDLGVAGLIFLGIGLVCSLIGRILLIGAAFGVSIWWGVGVFLPFGPMLFRLRYPDLASRSRYFRLAFLPCLLAYFVLQQPNGFSKLHQLELLESTQAPAAPANHYASEKTAVPSPEERHTANNRELERLKAWSEELRLKKRDLLHSDVQGNIAYDAELGQYEAAMAKAMAERQALFGSSR